MKCWSICLFSF